MTKRKKIKAKDFTVNSQPDTDRMSKTTSK